MSGFRVAEGGRIDRSTRLNFTFDGQAFAGHPGDTLASALMANGVSLLGRSFKYHRPRGLLAAGVEEPNALVTLDRGPGRLTPNLRATSIPLEEGLVARSQNNWPSLHWDWGAINARLKPLFPAGFYYKTFMGPAVRGRALFWNRLFEPLIRRAAGLGPAPSASDPDRYASRFAHAECLIVGAGVAGLKEALARSVDLQTRVILCDEGAELGGWLLNAAPGSADAHFLTEALAILKARPNVRLLPRTTCFGLFAQGFAALAEQLEGSGSAFRERLWQVRAGTIHLATGAIERPLVFPGNDRPGILLASAAETYLARYGVMPGRRIMVATATDSGAHAGFRLAEAGGTVAAILDLRPEPSPAIAAEAARYGLPYETGITLLGTTGKKRLTSVTYARNWTQSLRGPGETVEADTLLISGGFTPTLHLLSQARGSLHWDETLQAFLPKDLPPELRISGLATGDFPPEMTGAALGLLPGNANRASEAFVDFQNDVTARDIRLATQEGFRSIEHVKRYTTTGMATDQGKTSNINAMAIAAESLSEPLPKLGHTTFRQPYTPVTFGLFAGVHRGALFDPVRRTPMHDLARREGAVFEDIGQWKRAHAFPQPGETTADAIRRECRMVRERVGLFDASTLGKIEVTGPDAARFLDRIYTVPLAKLAVGRARYGLMLNEAGFIIDDGIVARLAEDRFHITTTTGGAARVLHWMEDYRQTEWPTLDCALTSVTEAWAVVAVQGPLARRLIAPLMDGIDVSGEAMPQLSIREGRCLGLPCRLMRASFTGELGFEINVPAQDGETLLERLLEDAQREGGGLYGLETMHILRAEKGYIVVGQETDGTVTPADLGLDWALGKTKPDFIGKRGLIRPDLVAPGRKQMVGLLPEEPSLVLEEGAQIIHAGDPVQGIAAEGHVTSSYFSANLGRGFALALLKNGAQRHGEIVEIPMPGARLKARVTKPLFIDPEGARLHG